MLCLLYGNIRGGNWDKEQDADHEAVKLSRALAGGWEEGDLQEEGNILFDNRP